MSLRRAPLRLRLHGGTTAHVASLYPFSLGGSSSRGPLVGVDALAGGAPFAWDPFEAYGEGLATNPNAWVMGEPGNGKSALVKSLLWRMAAVYGLGPDGRWLAVADPKGEYVGLAERLGLAVIRLSPGGHVRLNPLDDGPGAARESDDQRLLRRVEMVTALAASVLARPLSPVEDAAVFAAVEQLVHGRGPMTLVQVAAELGSPSPALLARLARVVGADTRAELVAVAYAVDKLVSRSLRGMFDGPSTVSVDWSGPGLVLDLSAVPLESEALPLVMVAAAGWLSQLMAGPGPQRVQVLDEAWAFLGDRHTARYLQSCFKLGRSYGVANLCVAHRPSDLGAQADDGTATRKIAAGLVADAATKIVLRQAPDQLDAAQSTFGLTGPERQIVGQLRRGRALWKVGGRTAVVQHVLAPAEVELCDTDGRMTRRPDALAA